MELKDSTNPEFKMSTLIPFGGGGVQMFEGRGKLAKWLFSFVLRARGGGGGATGRRKWNLEHVSWSFFLCDFPKYWWKRQVSSSKLVVQVSVSTPPTFIAFAIMAVAVASVSFLLATPQVTRSF